MRIRTVASLAAEAAFRARLIELGATLLETEWLGSPQKHRVRCREGHECRPRPDMVHKAKENFEERGLETLSIGCGLATWENKRAAWEPCAPVLLQAATLRPLGAAQDEFELAVVGETMEVNPTLLHVLKVDFGCEVDHAALMKRIPDGAIDEPWELEETY